MHELTADKLQIAYGGPALDSGRMPMLALSSGLSGQALLAERVKELLYGSSVEIRIEVDSEFDTGSFLVPVHVLSDAIRQTEHLLSGEGATALANLLALLGFVGVPSLYTLFKRLKGRKFEEPKLLPLLTDFDLPVDAVIRVYNDPEVHIQLRKVLDPLHAEGISEFETRRNGRIVARVSKKDLELADEAEVADLSKDEEITLDIEKCAWRRSLAWHFCDGRTSFDARITDEEFWRRIDQGEAFSEGDRLRVHLRTTAHRKSNGLLKVERLIPTVIEVEHVRRNQPKLFDQAEGGL